MTKHQTTVELTEELIPQAVLDEQEADRKERTYWEPKTKEERLETLDPEQEETQRDDFLKGLNNPDNIF